jgi:ABC-type transport system substrate-binding protein
VKRVAGTLIVLSLLAACSPSGDKPSAARGPTGGTLRIAITEPGSLDPGNAYEPAGMLVDDLLCEPLLTLDPKTDEVREGLASSWVVSDGGRRITLRLRKARFSNGARVTADHVIASLSRAASEEFAGFAAGLLEPIEGFDEISGRVDAKRERDRRRLRGLGAIDASSLSIQLRRKDADFLRVLAHPVAAPVDGDACAGPYRLDGGWAPGQPVVKLARNEHYHGRHPVYSAGGAGYPDNVEFHVVADPAAAWRDGAVDAAAVPFGFDAGAHLLQGLSGYLDFVGLPLGDSSPFKEAAVRRALSASLDRAALLAGRRPATGFVPGRECRVESDDVAVGDVSMPLYFNDQFANRTLAESVAAQWRAEFGIDVRPTPTTFAAIAEKGAQPGGVDGAFLMGWHPPAPRPDAYLAPMFTSAGIGRDNLTRFVDPDFERILDRDARGATDEDDVELGYQAAERRLCEQMPMIPLAAGVGRWAVRAGGSAWDESWGRPVLRELYVG